MIKMFTSRAEDKSLLTDHCKKFPFPRLRIILHCLGIYHLANFALPYRNQDLRNCCLATATVINNKVPCVCPRSLLTFWHS